MTYRIQHVVIEGFRAYGERTEFDCSGDVVVLVGPNGWGKTSFFDALTWCFFGRIPRLLGTRDAVGVDLIRNRFAPNTPPYVSVALQDDVEVVVVARDDDGLRVASDTGEMTADEAFEWVRSLLAGPRLPESDEAVTEARDDPQSIVLRCHLLAQDQMVAFLREANPRERFDALASLLGLDVVRSFSGHMSGVKKDLETSTEEARRRELQIQQRITSIRAEVEEIESLDDGTTPTLRKLLSEYGRLREQASALLADLGMEEEPHSARDLAVRARDFSVRLVGLADSDNARSRELIDLQEQFPIIEQRRQAIGELRDAREASQPRIAELRETAAELEASADSLSKEIARLSSQLQGEDERRAALSSFLAAALEHLVNDNCPVCQQSIDLNAVREDVRARLSAVPPSVVAIQEDLESARERSRRTEGQLHAAEGSLREEESRALEIERQIAANAAAIAAFDGHLHDVGAEGSTPLPETLRDEQGRATTRSRASRSLGDRADVLAKRAGFVAASEHLTRLRDQLRRFESDLADARLEVRSLVSSRTLAENVMVAARKSERDLLREMFDAIGPTLDALYSRLRPHPVLDRLRMDVGSFDERGEVRFIAYSPIAEANVTNIFSSAQLNAVAVCVFLAMNLGVIGSQAAFALLDDPIQNMDDFNVLGLLDLLRGLVGYRQFILSTHDEQIGDLVRRKLRPESPGNRAILHRFVAYRGGGPVIDSVTDDFVESPPVLAGSSS